jgi:Uma2 family endonuclease
MGTVGLLEIKANEVTLPTRRLSVAEYYRMGDAGILTEDDRVELVEGEVIQMPPIGSRHAYVVDELTRIFVKQVPDNYRVRIQNPIHLDEYSEVQPDLSLLKARDYTHAHPTPADVILLIEVMESSAAYDRRVKAPLYARHGIPELWLFDLAGCTVEVHRVASADGYREVLQAGKGEMLAPLALPNLKVPLDSLLP